MFMLTGFPHEEVPDIDTWLSKIYPAEDDRRKISDLIDKKIKREIEVKEHETTITRRNGQKRDVEFRFITI